MIARLCNQSLQYIIELQILTIPSSSGKDNVEKVGNMICIKYAMHFNKPQINPDGFNLVVSGDLI